MLAYWLMTACGGNGDLPCKIDLPDDVSFDDLKDLGKAQLELVNTDRAAFPDESDGAGALTWSDDLWSVAMCHAQDMCNQDYFAHDSKDGRSTLDRVEQGLGLKFGQDFFALGENLGLIAAPGVSVTSEQDQIVAQVIQPIHKGYMNECTCGEGCPSGKQAGHRSTILDPDLVEVGIAWIYCEDNQSFYNAMDFWRANPSDSHLNPLCTDGYTADPPSPVSAAVP